LGPFLCNWCRTCYCRVRRLEVGHVRRTSDSSLCSVDVVPFLRPPRAKYYPAVELPTQRILPAPVALYAHSSPKETAVHRPQRTTLHASAREARSPPRGPGIILREINYRHLAGHLRFRPSPKQTLIATGLAFSTTVAATKKVTEKARKELAIFPHSGLST